jgi:hypothetical protein
MKRFVISVAALMTLSGAAWAAVDANAPTPSGVVTTCETVSTQKTPNGQCVTATQNFLGELKSASLSPSSTDDSIVDLVDKLGKIALTRHVCDDANNEVAQAIKLAVGEVTDPDKKKAVTEIGDTIQACQFGQTSALPRVRRGPPTEFPGPNPFKGNGGPFASDNKA